MQFSSSKTEVRPDKLLNVMWTSYYSQRLWHWGLILIYYFFIIFIKLFINTFGPSVRFFIIYFTATLFHFSFTPFSTPPANSSVRTKTLTKTEKANIFIPQYTSELITGMLLSDGSLYFVGKSARFNIEQKHKDFVFDIWNELNSLGIVGKSPTPAVGVLNIYGKLTRVTTYRFTTFTLPYFTNLHLQWYKPNLIPDVRVKYIKTLPRNISELITARSLAFWLAGDGTFEKGRGRITLCTDNFSEDEVIQLSSILSNNFNISSSLRSITSKFNKIYFRLVIPTSQLSKVQNLVKPFMPKAMLYRIGLES